MKIEVLYINDKCKFESIEKGEWIDLRSSKNVRFKAPEMTDKGIKFDTKLVPLGFAMKLPKGFEANMVVRSSTFKNYNVIQTNAVGVIDSSYCGNEDEWKINFIAFNKSSIKEGDRICQFRIRPSQNASVWTKIKWLFTNKVEFVEVSDLCNVNRGGFGTTGVE